MRTEEERLRDLLAKEAKLAKRIADTQAKVKQREKARMMRRKILVGEAVLAAMEEDPDLKSKVEGRLRDTLKGDDLKLFSL